MNENTPNPNELVITRTFNAPRDLVWKVWTEPEHLMQWFGPKGFTMPHCQLDLKPGGSFLYCLRSTDGMEMWGKWIFREIVAPERIVLIQHFSDKDGGVTRHPMAPGWPAETFSTMTLTENAGKTTLTLRWAAHNATDAERKLFNASHASMQQGWGGTFEQLEHYLAKTQENR